MKKRIFSVITALALCLSLLPATALAAGSITYISYTWEAGGRVKHDNTLDKTYGNIIDSSTTLGQADGQEHWYVVDTTVEITERITVTGNVHLILTDNCTLTASKGISVNEGNSLTIYATSDNVDSMGKLTATAEPGTAGVGGDSGSNSGTITIHGGDVTAAGENGGAGIGGGEDGSGGRTTIYGGRINTTGVAGAGLGGGVAAGADIDGGIITIYGGDITATGKGGGAGIGGGFGYDSNKQEGGSGGMISIYGGKVKATGEGDFSGAGIGGGFKGDGGRIDLYGGEIEAKGTAGAGIGGGACSPKGNGGTGGEITITGGKVTATSENGAGIGGGFYDYISGVGANGGTISITGGEVTAKGGSKAYDIGGGKTGVPSDKIEIGGGAKVTTGGAGIGVSHVADTTKWVSDNDNKHWRPCQVSPCDQNHKYGETDHNYPTAGNINGSGQLVYKCSDCQHEKIYNCSGISVTTQPTLTYTEGAPLDLSGLKITATFTNGDEKKVELAYNAQGVDYFINNTRVTNGQTTLSNATHNGQKIKVTWQGQEAETEALTVQAPVTPPDYTADVAAAKADIEAKTWTVDQADANTEAAVKSWIERQLAGMDLNGVKPTVSVTQFTQASGGTNGSFTFTVALSKGGENDTAGPRTGTITATPVTPPTTYTVTVSATPGGTASVNGSGPFPSNSSVTVEATANSGHHFVRWTENDAEVSTNAKYTFIITGPRTLVAEFAQDSTPSQPDKFAVTVQGGTGSGSYAQDEDVTITASVPSGKEFTGWTITPSVTFTNGGLNSPTATFIMPGEAVTATANYQDLPPATYSVTVRGGSADKTSAAQGEDVTITASVPSGKRFTGWTITPSVTFTNGGLNSSRATFIMPSGNVEATAHFEAIPTPPSSGGGGYTPPPTYPPTVEKPSGGDVTIKPSRPSTGDKVTVTPKPDEGYKVDEITITDRNGRPVNVTQNPDGTYSFTQPSGKVTIRVTYKPIEIPWHNPFADVSENDWYYEAVRFVHERGLMGGYGNGLFGPNNNLSRAQLAQILFNNEGRPGVNYLLRFEDVPSGVWYTEAVRWATSQGIVGGYGGGKFGPNDPITREQLAVMLWRYSGSPAATEKELHFSDADKISGYALEAMRWAVENGIIGGYGNGQVGPGGQATRAQVAQMLMRFFETDEK